MLTVRFNFPYWARDTFVVLPAVPTVGDLIESALLKRQGEQRAYKVCRVVWHPPIRESALDSHEEAAMVTCHLE